MVAKATDRITCKDPLNFKHGEKISTVVLLLAFNRTAQAKCFAGPNGNK